jgi:hypothetical protein
MQDGYISNALDGSGAPLVYPGLRSPALGFGLWALGFGLASGGWWLWARRFATGARTML